MKKSYIIALILSILSITSINLSFAKDQKLGTKAPLFLAQKINIESLIIDHSKLSDDNI